jgi:splicing factor 3A subunit 1
MMAKIKETTLAPDEEISRNIIGLARTRPDIFGTTEEEVSNAVMAEIEKKRDEQPKQVIWDGHSGSIGRTATQAMSMGAEEQQFDASNVRGPAPLPQPGMPLPRPPQPLPLINVPRFTPNPMPYHIQPPPHHMQGVPHMMPNMHQPPPPGQQQMISIPPPPGHTTQFMPGPPRFSMPPPPLMPTMPTMVNPIGIPQPPPPLPPQPPSEEQPPLPDEPEPKRLRTDDASLIPAEQFLAQHPVMSLLIYFCISYLLLFLIIWRSNANIYLSCRALLSSRFLYPTLMKGTCEAKFWRSLSNHSQTQLAV